MYNFLHLPLHPPPPLMTLASLSRSPLYLTGPLHCLPHPSSNLPSQSPCFPSLCTGRHFSASPSVSPLHTQNMPTPHVFISYTHQYTKVHRRMHIHTYMVLYIHIQHIIYIYMALCISTPVHTCTQSYAYIHTHTVHGLIHMYTCTYKCTWFYTVNTRGLMHTYVHMCTYIIHHITDSNENTCILVFSAASPPHTHTHASEGCLVAQLCSQLCCNQVLHVTVQRCGIHSPNKGMYGKWKVNIG